MNQKLLLFGCLGILLSACGQNPEAKIPAESINLDSLIQGSWENISLEVVVNSYNNTDSSYSILVPNGEWEEKMGIKPIKTEFKANNTYSSIYRNLGDSIIQTTRGVWNTFGDTLMMIESDATYEYYVRIRDHFAEFNAILDWDGDGKLDDSYKGIQEKQTKE